MPWLYSEYQAKNVAFYKKCGFGVFDEREFSYNGKTMRYWSICHKPDMQKEKKILTQEKQTDTKDS